MKCIHRNTYRFECVVLGVVVVVDEGDVAHAGHELVGIAVLGVENRGDLLHQYLRLVLRRHEVTTHTVTCTRKHIRLKPLPQCYIWIVILFSGLQIRCVFSFLKCLFLNQILYLTTC